MKSTNLFSLAAATALASIFPQAHSQETPEKAVAQFTADDVMTRVRNSYALFDRKFTGYLRQGLVKEIPFTLDLRPEAISFTFVGPSHVIYLDKQSDTFFLLEATNGASLRPVPPKKFAESIRGTDLSYDDLSMRFLYWPNPRILKEERFNTLDTWRVRLNNPDGRGPYASVECWIDKNSGGLAKMTGFNRQNRAIRQFEVLHGRKFGDVWMVDEMRIETLSSASGNRKSSTRLQIREMVP